MFPSPSLGPPLLSASWSPPLFCGIPEDEGAELAGAAACVVVVVAGAALADDLCELPPHAATNRATAARPATSVVIRARAIRCSRRRRWGRRCCRRRDPRRCAAGSRSGGASSCDGACGGAMRCGRRLATPARSHPPRTQTAQRRQRLCRRSCPSCGAPFELLRISGCERKTRGKADAFPAL